MTQARQTEQTPWPQTPGDIESVRAQLERMLQNPLFSHSRRYPHLLRRIVEDSLAGNFDNLKERVLGIELFDRPPDYDTNADAIVRVTAAEIRKRIAQYYHEKDHHKELRIDLPVGGYVAQFKPPQVKVETEESAPLSNTVQENPERVQEGPPPPDQRPPRRRKLLFFAGAAGLVIVLALGVGHWIIKRNVVDTFWYPFISGKSQPLLCVGQLPVSTASQGPQDSLARSLLGQKPVSISDAIVVSKYATYLGTKDIQPRIQVSTATTYTDLRYHPVLLIGGLDNSWTLWFLQGLRYRMSSTPTSPVLQIYDSRNPAATNWKMNFAASTGQITDDYAIVSRFYDQSTQNTVVIAAGLGEDGTAAAADFLLHPQYLKSIDQTSPHIWEKKNMELVLKTQIIDGTAGPPSIIARYFW